MTATAERTSGGVEVDRVTFYRLLAGVRDDLAGYGMPGIPADHFFFSKLPLVSGRPTPCLLVSPGPESINDQAGTNARDDTGYGVLISIVRASTLDPRGDTPAFAQELAWRDRVRRRYINRRPEFDLKPADWIRTQVTAGEPVVPEAWRRQQDAQYTLMRFTLREGRDG